MIKVEFSFDSVEALTVFLAKVETPPPVEDPALRFDPVELSKPLTIADLRQAILDASNRNQSTAVRDLLGRYGVKKASELPEDQWPKFYAEVVDLGHSVPTEV